RPLQIGGRQIDAAAVNIRIFSRQTEGARAYDAAVDHEVVKVVLGENLVTGLRRLPLVLFADGHFVTAQRGFDAVDEAHAVRMRAVVGRFDDLAHRAAGRQYPAGGVFDLHAGHDLRAGGQNEMAL